MTIFKKERNIITTFLIALLILSAIPFLSYSASVYYMYDDLGRLSAAVSETGDVAIYTYDEVGNLLSITRQTINTQPPILASITPDNIFVNTSVSIKITGENLFATEKVWSDNNGITVNSFSSTDSSVSASLTISPDAPLGETNMNVKTYFGTANIPLFIAKLHFKPSPVTMLPGTDANINAWIGGASKELIITLVNQDPDIISIPQSITIPAGGSSTFIISALNEGTGVIIAEDINTGVSVYVSQPFSGNLTASAKPVSIRKLKDIDGTVMSQPVSIKKLKEIDGTVMSAPISVIKSAQ